MKMGELRTKGNIGLEGTCRHHQIFFLDKTIPSRFLSQVPLRIPCAFTTSMASWCLSQPGAHLHPLVSMETSEPLHCQLLSFSSKSSQFFLSAHTPPQRAPLITVRKGEKYSCLNTASQTPNPLGGFAVPPDQTNPGTCNKKKLLSTLCVIYCQNLLQDFSALLNEAGLFSVHSMHPA